MDSEEEEDLLVIERTDCVLTLSRFLVTSDNFEYMKSQRAANSKIRKLLDDCVPAIKTQSNPTTLANIVFASIVLGSKTLASYQ